MDADDGVLEPQDSGVRRLAAIVAGDDYIAYRSLTDARSDPDAAVILEGDSGGQIYLTCPVRRVHCDEDALRTLLADLDRVGWADPNGAGLHFERRPVGSTVMGGKGGGTILEGLWVHPELSSPGLNAQIEAVLAADRPALDLTAGRRAVWRTADLSVADRPADLGLPPLSAQLLDDVLDALGRGPAVEGRVAVFGFGSLVLELRRPSGGKVTLLAWPTLARVAFDGLAHDATVDLTADPFEYERAVALLRGVVDTGLAVRTVGTGVGDEVEGAVTTTILMTVDEDGESDETFWSPDPVSVDWLTAQLGPVEWVAPLRGVD